MSIINQGILVIDSSYNETTDFCQTTAIPSKYDTNPGTILFINATVGVIWWIMSMFIYRANTRRLKDTSGNDTVPLVWFWQ